LLGASKFLPQVVERIEDAFTEEDAAKKKEWHNYGKDGGGAEEDAGNHPDGGSHRRAWVNHRLLPRSEWARRCEP
jgi:hypothetical protein